MFISWRCNFPQFESTHPETPYPDSAMDSCSLLGVTIYNRLWCFGHIEQIIMNCKTYLYITPRIKLYISADKRKLSSNAYILHHFDLSCVILRNCTKYIIYTTSETSEKDCRNNS